MYTYPFEKLEVWQLSKQLVVKIYKLSSAFPAEEKFGLVSQMRRSAISVSSNLAEGSSRRTEKDQVHFYNIAYGSLMELLNQLLIAADLNWIQTADIIACRQDIEVVSRKIHSLRNARLSKPA